MTREDVLDRLKASEALLRERGVLHAALFGSRARGDAGPRSDTDILIEIESGRRLTIYDYAGLKEYIEALFDGPVDVVRRDRLRAHVASDAEAEAIYAF